MNREQEALLVKYTAEGKTKPSFTFWVRHKLTGKVSPILGSMVSGFLCPKTYELFEENPKAPAVEDAPVAELPVAVSAPTKKKKKR